MYIFIWYEKTSAFAVYTLGATLKPTTFFQLFFIYAYSVSVVSSSEGHHTWADINLKTITKLGRNSI